MINSITKKIKFLICFLLMFSLTFSFLVFAQASLQGDMQEDMNDAFMSDFESHIWNMSDGLPGNTITDIMQDNSGYICLGTYEGLAKFDGLNFTTLNRVNDPRYTFASARSILQDEKGNVWVGSNDEGVALITPDLTVTMFTQKQGLPNNSIRSLAQDFDGNIWVGTANGVAFITPQGNIVRPKGLEEYGKTGILIETIYCDNAGKIWITSPVPNCVYFYANGQFNHYTQITSIKDPIIDAIAQDSRGAFWFGVSPHFVVKIDSTVETVFDVGNGSQKGAAVHHIMQDKSGNMWFALESGIAVLHSGKFLYYNQFTGLVDNNIKKVLEDREGNIWIATDRGGLQKLTLSKFKTFPLPTSVNAIAQDPNTGEAWVGTDEGLYAYDVSVNPIKKPIMEYCKDSRIRHLGFTDEGDLLISTYGNYAQIRYKKDGTIDYWNKEKGLSGNKTRVAIQTQNGDLYIGTTSGLNIIDHTTGAIRIINREDGINNDYIMCLYEDKTGTVWVGTDGGGVFTIKNGKITASYTTTYKKSGQLQYTFEAGRGLAGNVIFKIQEIKDGEMWFCTGTGISRLKNGKFFNFTSANGLGTDSIFQMIVDFTGKVWMTSNHGISYVKLSALEDLADGKTSKMNVKFTSSSDGIHSTGITSTSLSMKDRLGQVWFTLADGFAIYNPMKVNLQKLVPGIHIEKIIVDDKVFPYNGAAVVVPPKAKRVIIQYTGLTFIAPEQLVFRYKLQGFEDKYSDWQNARSVSYTNLKPGNYEFTVVAMNSEDIESPISAPLVIIKKPLFYQHWYFWPLVVLLVAGVVGLFIRMRIMQMKRYQEALEQEVKRQTAEIRQKSRDLEVEKNKSERLLLNILPQTVAKELSESPNKIIADQYEGVSILFSDIVGFTKMSSTMKATQVVNMLNVLFSKFDLRAESQHIEKIKTIGDAYMAVCGLDSKTGSNASADLMLKFAQGMFQDLEDFNLANNMNLQMRVGINTGTIVAGVIGKTKYIYDIWGDSVNVASRMESTGTPGRVHITEDTFMASRGGFSFEEPVQMQIKGKGLMKTYLLK